MRARAYLCTCVRVYVCMRVYVSVCVHAFLCVYTDNIWNLHWQYSKHLNWQRWIVRKKISGEDARGLRLSFVFVCLYELSNKHVTLYALSNKHVTLISLLLQLEVVCMRARAYCHGLRVHVCMRACVSVCVYAFLYANIYTDNIWDLHLSLYRENSRFWNPAEHSQHQVCLCSVCAPVCMRVYVPNQLHNIATFASDRGCVSWAIRLWSTCQWH